MELKPKTIYSFSRLTSVDSCAYGFYKSYVLEEKGEANAFALGGSFGHELCEGVAKKEITTQKASARFKAEWFEKVYLDYPKFPSGYDLKSHYYKKCQPFFDRKAYWKGEVVSVEEHVVFTLPSGEKFQGFIDLVIKQDNSSIDFVDWKISKKFSKEDLIKKQRQLYLYAYAYHQIHGVYPKRLIFSFFQDASSPIIIDFQKYYMDEAVQWAELQIGKIKLMTGLDEFEPNINDLMEPDGSRNMYCNALCNHRSSCKFVEGNFFKRDVE